MHKTFDFKKYVEYKVYSVTTIKNGYGFRVLLTFADESDSYILEPILYMEKSG